MTQQIRQNRRIKCNYCNRIGAYSSGYCFWCKRKNNFHKGIVSLSTGKQYTGGDKDNTDLYNKKHCDVRDCKELLTKQATSTKCIKHRVMLNK